MSRSRPPSPPRATEEHTAIHFEFSIESSSPKRSSSTDSASSSAFAQDLGMERKPSVSEPTNTLIITPLPLPFFEPRILDALRAHFASFSTTFLHRRSPYSPSSAYGPGASIRGDAAARSGDDSDDPLSMEDDEEVLPEQEPEGDLYSFVPLKSFKRAIVVYYSNEDAERARLASDRLFIPETPRCPAVTLRAFRGPPTVLVEDGWFPGTKRRHIISDDAEEGSWYFGGFPMVSSLNYDDDDGEIKESPFHLRPPVPERNFLISPPGSPPVGWVAVREDPPNEVPLAEDLMEALERVKAQRMAASAQRVQKRRRFSGDGPRSVTSSSKSRSRSGSDSDSDDMEELEQEGVMLIPESAAGLCVRVENWSTRRLIRLHQSREKTRRQRERANSNPLDKKKTRDTVVEVQTSITEMEIELDEELDDGRYASGVDWNRIDHARTIIPVVDIPIDDAEGGGTDNSLFLSERAIKGAPAKAPKLGAKPAPARMPPVPSIGLDFPGINNGLGMAGFKPTAMPPLRPTAMPPFPGREATESSASLASISSTAVEPSLTPTHTPSVL